MSILLKYKLPFYYNDDDIINIIKILTECKDLTKNNPNLKSLFKLNFNKLHRLYTDADLLDFLAHHILNVTYILHCTRNNLNKWDDDNLVYYDFDNFNQEYYLQPDELNYIRSCIITYYIKKVKSNVS